MRCFFGFATFILVAGCSSIPSRDFQAARVIERIGGKNATPEWATGETPMSLDGGYVYFSNNTTMSGDSRTEGCVKAAEETGRAQLLRYIKDAVTSGGQVNELNAVSDPGYESLTAFFAAGNLSGVSVANRYWERVEESDSSGSRVLRLRCSARLSIQRSTLERQLREATNVASGNSAIREKLLSAQGQFIEGLSKRNPASTENGN